MNMTTSERFGFKAKKQKQASSSTSNDFVKFFSILKNNVNISIKISLSAKVVI